MLYIPAVHHGKKHRSEGATIPERIAELLQTHEDELLRYDEIKRAVWGTTDGVTDDLLYVYTLRLRRAFRHKAALKVIRGVGVLWTRLPYNYKADTPPPLPMPQDISVTLAIYFQPSERRRWLWSPVGALWLRTRTGDSPFPPDVKVDARSAGFVIYDVPARQLSRVLSALHPYYRRILERGYTYVRVWSLGQWWGWLSYDELVTAIADMSALPATYALWPAAALARMHKSNSKI